MLGARGPPSRSRPVTRRNPGPGAAHRPPTATLSAPRRARSPQQTDPHTHSPALRRDLGSRRPEEGRQPPSPPLRPRAACHRGPRSREPAGPPGTGGARKNSPEARGEDGRKGGSRGPTLLETKEEAEATTPRPGPRNARVVVLVVAATGRATPNTAPSGRTTLARLRRYG
ncbi:Hypothetical predicted protein [Marmota monax]|uniref:Uncharacterized protein n=1 Tax=Marmota monax TaxID=9995 RepID=A0A5E4D1P5_MARMO|nr:hypothetical protein GHT09_015668 [Marmota monax]VTJ87480.1 Hypothetical predicted protein [Marmota monax]